MPESNLGSNRDPIEALENFGTGGVPVSPLDPAAVRRLGDQRRRRQNTMYGVIAAVVVAVAVIPTAVIATKGDGEPNPAPNVLTTPPPTPSPTPTPTPSSNPTSSPTATPTSKVIVFPGQGVTIKAPGDTDKLIGTSEEFQAFIKTVWRKDHDQGCAGAEVDVMKYSSDGFGAGGVGGCGGYQALWALRAGVWKEVLGTQDEFVCSDLAKYDVPDGFAKCYVPTPPPAVVTFPGQGGIRVEQKSDTAALQDTTSDFKNFIASLLPKVKAEVTDCFTDPGKGGVNVFKFARAGYASGSVDGCSGHAAIWKDVDGTWKEVLASQEEWTCADLAKYDIPPSFAQSGVCS